MSEIFVDDKVKNAYLVFIGVKADEEDMRAVADEFNNFGYKKIVDTSHNDDVILIYAS